MRTKLGVRMLVLVGFIFTMLVGCKQEDVSLSNQTVGIIGEQGNDVVVEEKQTEVKSLTTEHTVEFGGRTIRMNMIYSAESDRIDDWVFTQPSSIELQASVIENYPGVEIMVSEVYADISLVSKQARYNGMRQDSLNINYRELPTGGISIRKGDSYTLPFQIEAVDKSETFFHMFNGYGSSSTERIRESDLASAAQGTMLRVVWTFLFKEEGSENLYVKTITDSIGIPYLRGMKEQEG